MVFEGIFLNTALECGCQKKIFSVIAIVVVVIFFIVFFQVQWNPKMQLVLVLPRCWT